MKVQVLAEHKSSASTRIFTVKTYSLALPRKCTDKQSTTKMPRLNDNHTDLTAQMRG